MKIELLGFDGCPNMEPTEKLLRDTLAELGVETSIRVVQVNGPDEAESNRFLGSPSIRIDGRDLEVEEDEHTPYSMRCRVYETPAGPSGMPPRKLLRERILAAARAG